jgi:hypothetical protein
MRPDQHDDEQEPPTPEQWAERHDGLFTTAVAAAAGLSPYQLSRRRASGRSRSIRRNVSAIGGAPVSRRQAIRAVALTVKDDVFMSHSTAAWLLGGPCPSDDWLHVSGPLARSVCLPGVKCHRTGTLEDEDVVTRREIRCTSPLRTVLDLSGSLTVAELGKLVDYFLRNKTLRLEDLRGRVSRTRSAPGRSVRTLHQVLRDRIPGYDPGESELEGRLARIIIRAGLPAPAQQHRVDYGASRYRVDFAWPERNLYLEGNGFGWHQLSSDLDKDASRQNEFVLDGWTPIELTWRMSDQVIETTLRRFMNRTDGTV